MPAWDHASNEQFYNYNAQENRNPETLVRFRASRDTVFRVAVRNDMEGEPLEVADYRLWGRRSKLGPERTVT